MNDAGLNKICDLSRDLGFHSSALCQLATKLRLAHSSRLTQQLATVDAQAQPADPVPWRDWGDRARKRESDKPDDDTPN